MLLRNTENDRDGISVLDTKDLLSELAHLVVGLTRSDSVSQHESLTSAHVLIAHSGVFLLTSSIQDIEQASLVVDGDLFSLR